MKLMGKNDVLINSKFKKNDPKNLTSNIHILFGYYGNRLWINECIATKKRLENLLTAQRGL